MTETSGYGTTPGGASYGQPAYGQPGFGGPVGSPQPYGAPTGTRNGMGIAALVLGILAIVTSFSVIGGILFGILALIFGLIGRGRAKRGESTTGGLALAGVITGIIGIVLSGALLAFGLSVLNSSAGKNLQSCLQQAGSDQAAVQACQRQFQDEYNR